jgi:hypothetical protein
LNNADRSSLPWQIQEQGKLVVRQRYHVAYCRGSFLKSVGIRISGQLHYKEGFEIEEDDDDKIWSECANDFRTFLYTTPPLIPSFEKIRTLPVI